MVPAIEQGMPLNNQVEHNFATVDTALKLYAINKWANENNIEIVFHIHFQRLSRKKIQPDWRIHRFFNLCSRNIKLPNHRASSKLAESLKNQLEKYFTKSDLPAESSRFLIEDQELIDVGSNASRDGVSVLVEYGYIYEPPFRNEEAREAMFKELAYQTYIGIKIFLAMPPRPWIITRPAPALFMEQSSEKGADAPKTFSLQMALHKEGLYPPMAKLLATAR